MKKLLIGLMLLVSLSSIQAEGNIRLMFIKNAQITTLSGTVNTDVCLVIHNMSSYYLLILDGSPFSDYVISELSTSTWNFYFGTDNTTYYQGTRGVNPNFPGSNRYNLLTEFYSICP